EIRSECRRVDVVCRLRAVTAHLQNERYRAPSQLLAQHRLDLRLQPGDIVRQLDDRLEIAVVQGSNLDRVMGAVELARRVAEPGHADNHLRTSAAASGASSEEQTESVRAPPPWPDVDSWPSG